MRLVQKVLTVVVVDHEVVQDHQGVPGHVLGPDRGPDLPVVVAREDLDQDPRGGRVLDHLSVRDDDPDRGLCAIIMYCGCRG